MTHCWRHGGQSDVKRMAGQQTTHVYLCLSDILHTSDQALYFKWTNLTPSLLATFPLFAELKCRESLVHNLMCDIKIEYMVEIVNGCLGFRTARRVKVARTVDLIRRNWFHGNWSHGKWFCMIHLMRIDFIEVDFMRIDFVEVDLVGIDFVRLISWEMISWKLISWELISYDWSHENWLHRSWSHENWFCESWSHENWFCRSSSHENWFRESWFHGHKSTSVNKPMWEKQHVNIT